MIYTSESVVGHIQKLKFQGREKKKELILNNHSQVMYDYDLIPKEQIRETNNAK